MRGLLAAGCVALACSVPNPDFDLAKRGDDRGGDESGDSSATSGATSGATSSATSSATSTTPDTDTDAPSGSSTGAGSPDLGPEQGCEHERASGLALAFGDPNTFGGNCPGGVDVWARMDLDEDGGALVSTCGPGCVGCSNAHPLSAFPVAITDHVPFRVDECVRIEATVSLGHDGVVCFWGALTIYDAASGAPYLVAIAHSNEPTPTGAESLGNAIPIPQQAGTCDCADLPEVDVCCDQAASSPEFFHYALDGEALLPGDSAPLSIPNALGIAHLFGVFQAQAIPTCEGNELDLSWAVLAEV